MALARKVGGAGQIAAITGAEHPSGHLFHDADYTVSNGTTRNIDIPDGTRLAVIEVSLTGQTLLIGPGGGQMNYGGICIRHDGSVIHANPSAFSDFRSLFGNQQYDKGNYNATIRMMRSTGSDWFGHLSGYVTLTAGNNVWDHGGTYWRFHGRFYTPAVATGLKVITYAGESGSVRIRGVGYRS